ncbi:MAG: hypothetical protein NVS3B5_02880 [Sphingomicrobium sp.]
MPTKQSQGLDAKKSAEWQLDVPPPARLQIAAILAKADTAQFGRLKAINRTSDSVMSRHFSALWEASYLKLRKATAAGRQRTCSSLTEAGRGTFNGHVTALEALPPGLAQDPK